MRKGGKQDKIEGKDQARCVALVKAILGLIFGKGMGGMPPMRQVLALVRRTCRTHTCPPSGNVAPIG